MTLSIIIMRRIQNTQNLKARDRIGLSIIHGLQHQDDYGRWWREYGNVVTGGKVSERGVRVSTDTIYEWLT